MGKIAKWWHAFISVLRRLFFRIGHSESTTRIMNCLCRANEIVIELDLVNEVQYKISLDEFGAIVRNCNALTFCTDLIESVHPEDRDEVVKYCSEEYLKSLVEEVGKAYYECRIKQDEQYCWYAFMLASMPAEIGNEGKLVVFGRNIDETKRREHEYESMLRDALVAAQSANDAKSSFMSRMSHEIRTPLNAILGYHTLARKVIGSDDEKVLDCLDKSERSAKHLLSIINDVLDISSIESGKLKVASEPFALKNMIFELSDMFSGQAAQKGIDFDIILSDVVNEQLVGDVLHLKQVLINLLSNAMKFTPEGKSVRLFVNQLAQRNEKVYFRFIVRDTGIGMKPEFMDRLFEPFSQQDTAISRKYGGSGLGLSITRNLVNMMNGAITVKSHEGVGTTFVVELPFGIDSSIISTASEDYTNIRALIIDDDYDAREYLASMFESFGITCELCKDSPEAMEKLQAQTDEDKPFSICLIDWRLPTTDGLTASVPLRKLLGEDVPIFLITAHDRYELESEAKKLGFKRVLTKPLFASTIKSILTESFGEDTRTIAVERPCENYQGRKVLIAEDNEFNMEIATELLKSMELEVDCAVNGQEALDMFTSSEVGTYSLIFMDIQMPVMDGYDATRRIRNSGHPQAISIPIIAMTANAFAEDITSSLAAGMNYHVSKPIDVKMLHQAVREYMPE